MKTNELMTKASRFAAKAKYKLGKHSPEILMVGGAIGVVASAVMACRATLKVNDILDAHKETVTTIHDVKEGKVGIPQNESYTEEDMKKDLTTAYVQTGMNLVKLYAPAVILGGLSLGCMVGSNHILQKRNAALTAAYVTLDKAFGDYKERVTERFGGRVQQELEQGIKAVEVESKNVDENGVEEIVKSYEDEAEGAYSPYALIYDETMANWEPDAEMNRWRLKQVEIAANRRLKSQGHLFLNEVYEMIGRRADGSSLHTPIGQVVGWIFDPENPDISSCVDIGIHNLANPQVAAFNAGYERSIVLNFNCDGPIINKI